MTSRPSDSDHNSASAFHLLHPDVQEQLYRMQWTDLRPVQVKSTHAVLGGSKDLIITAPTAGGKTEAAFLPILSLMRSQSDRGIQAVYVGPLKALINDQFGRLELLCQELEIPVHKWHGDVSASKKKKLLESPAGILLITPESLESILLNFTAKVGLLFRNLKFVVIDELHSFFANERGAQLRSQIVRVSQYCNSSPRVVALSATVGDMNLAAEWLRPGKQDSVDIIKESGGEREIRIGVGAYGLVGAINEDDEDGLDDRLVSDLFRHFSGKKGLVFGNAKAQIEDYADAVKSEAARRGVRDNFLVHHGSLGKFEREFTEDELKSDRKVAVFCSSTLELGIDIGPVELVGQIGSPFSVNSFLQRLGRSGRREGQPATMRLYYVAESQLNPSLPERLHLELIRICAECELVSELWCESPRPADFHLSTLVHQILASIAEHGGLKAKPLFDLLVSGGAFPDITQEQFGQLLRNLASKDLIEQDSAGLIMLGLKGEAIVRRYDFYAVFQTPKEYDVRHEHHTIGSVAYTPGPNPVEFLILAGKRWQITSVDDESHVIHVIPSRGRKKPSFISSSAFEIDDKIPLKMREILLSSTDLRYCDTHAKKELDEARREASSAGLADEVLFEEGHDVLWFTWKGSRANRTLALALSKSGYKASECDIGVLRVENCDIKGLLAASTELARAFPRPSELGSIQERFDVEKFDEYIPDELWQHQFCRNSLDFDSALDSANTLSGTTLRA